MSRTSDPGAPAIGGYDAVAYFKQGSPTKGNGNYSVEHGGSTWLFSNEEHANEFRASPDKYAPAYNGHCAFAASLGKTEAGNPKNWALRSGRLFLNSNAVAHVLWKVLPGRVQAGDRNWKDGRVGGDA